MKTKKRVLILGASGFVGFNLKQWLSPRKDFDVWGTYRTNRYNRINPSGKYLQTDLTKQEEVAEVMDSYDVVLHAAAFSSGAKDTKTRPWVQVNPSNVMNTWVLQSAFNNKAGHVIFFGSSVIYPSREEPSKETDVDENNLSEVHRYAAKMKLLAEEQCRVLSQYGQTKFTVIRPSNLYGHYDRFDPDRSHVFAATIRKVAEAKDSVTIWGKGEEMRDFLYIEDFCRLVELVIDSSTNYKFDIFNAGSGKATSISELHRKVIRVAGKDHLKISYDPQAPSIGTKISIDSSKAREKFGWEPMVALEEGIERTLTWYKQDRTLMI